MTLNNQQVLKFLERKLPPQIAREFIVPIIASQHKTFEGESEILEFLPTGYPFNVGFLMALKWHRTNLSIDAVKASLAMSDQAGAAEVRIEECKQEYQIHGKLSPPVLIDAHHQNIGYVLMDGVHRFAALKKLKVKNHDFWEGTYKEPSKFQKLIERLKAHIT